MNRSEFSAFCEEYDLAFTWAGRNWHTAEAEGDFPCAVICGPIDFAAVKLLLYNGDGYLANAQRKHGQAWFEHCRYGGIIYSDNAVDVAKKMADEYASFLESNEDICYWSDEDINRRDEKLFDNPALKGESEDEHFKRVEEMLDGEPFPPLRVDEPGFWSHAHNILVLSDAKLKNGIWSYDYDNWSRHVIFVLNDEYEDK